MRRRPPRSTQSRSSAASDVYKRQHTDGGERTTGTKLPEIPAFRRAESRDRFLDPGYSPFVLPNDDEVFVFREAERSRKEESRKKAGEQKIWEKPTATTRMAPRNFRNTELSNASASLTRYPKASYSRQDQALIQQAVEVIRARKKEKEESAGSKKEGIVEIVEQKKEMFLVEKTVNNIREEIARLKQIAEDKSAALEQSEKMLQVDKERFFAFYEENKEKKKYAEDALEEVIKGRKEKENDIKALSK
eukprot:TRINITY_DN20800_c0_g1_i2.p1 TRINITY_DN20800_c0_g1~~TRINITY_DN20800_c0_g1_i2.p1  ORF type:complete len:248 (-),score=80.24 TRINITY_DN20800_c0_g1_i2:79-822(-)